MRVFLQGPEPVPCGSFLLAYGMRARLCLPLLLLAFAACDRVSSPSIRDAGVDSLASLWERVDGGAVNYNAVAGSAPDNVFIVGDQGTILHWDGLTLAREESGTTVNLRGISVFDPTLARAVGEGGTVLVRQDGLWLPEADGLTTATLNATWTIPAYAIAVGEQGVILVNTGGAWSLLANTRTDNLYAVAQTVEGTFVVGALGIVMAVGIATQTVSQTWTIPGYTKVLAGATPFSNGMLLVGMDSGCFYWEQGVATRLTIEGMPRTFMRAVSSLGTHVWTVGHEGWVSANTQDGHWVVLDTPDHRWLTGVYAAATDDLWIVGRSGLILRGPPGVRGVQLDGGMP